MEGDTLIVTKLDRLARSTQHLLEIAERVKAKGADLSILNLGADTSTATGRLMFTVAEIKALKADGVRPVEIARQLRISRASVYRVLAA